MKTQQMISKLLEEKQEKLSLLCQKEAEIIKKRQMEQKSKNLLKWGLYEKVYQENDSDFAIYDIKEEKYYIRKPLEIDDSDYEKLLEMNTQIDQISERIKRLKHKENNMPEADISGSKGSGYMAVAIAIIIVTFIIAIILLSAGGGYGFTVLAVGFLVGLVFIAIADILKKLSLINLKLKNAINSTQHIKNYKNEKL